jgi:CRISPR/Cas system-associated exonuclease Cas4 (RecB family)
VRKYFYPHQAYELKAALNWLSEQPRYQRSVVVVFEMNKEFRQIADQVVLHYNQNLARIPLEQGLDKVALSSGEPLIHHPLIAELFTLLVGQKSIPTFFIDSTLVIASLDLNKLLVRSLQAWNNFLIELLVTAQWCQDIQLTSHEYQARAMFLVKIQELSQRCSSFVSDCSYGQWVYLLKLFIASTTFQPQSLSQEHSLMGLLEAAPLGFDHVWLIGADFMKIPQSLNPHPLLPTEFQEKYSMPHAHIQREMTYLKSILARVFQAQDCTISYAQTDGVKMIHSSPMLDRLLPGTYEKQDSLMTQSSFLNLSFFKQEYVKSVLSHRVTVAQLNQFLQCPFRGMSRTLSGVEAPVQTKLPIDPARHGQLMHQYIQERLKNESGEHALQRYVHSWPKQLQATERHRLEHLYGLVRQHFVGGTEQLRFEQKVSFYMGRWLIEGRADIWDPEAEHVYDIKSKNFSVSSWFSSEPTDIQGSLYTIGLKAKALGLIRLTQPTVFITSESVASYLPDWSSQVQRLLKRWDEGNFEPAPQHSGICHHCRLKKACRYVAP